jgi:hypothetical protein
MIVRWVREAYLTFCLCSVIAPMKQSSVNRLSRGHKALCGSSAILFMVRSFVPILNQHPGPCLDRHVLGVVLW